MPNPPMSDERIEKVAREIDHMIDKYTKQSSMGKILPILSRFQSETEKEVEGRMFHAEDVQKIVAKEVHVAISETEKRVREEDAEKVEGLKRYYCSDDDGMGQMIDSKYGAWVNRGDVLSAIRSRSAKERK